MKVDKLTLERVFERTERLEAPLFQRPYVWNRGRNWVPLWESIRAVADSRFAGTPTRAHFLGTIVLEQLKTSTGKTHARQIIDGQQRLTTLQLALAAARDLCQKIDPRYADEFRKLTNNNVPLSDEPDDVFKVWPTNADRNEFRDVMKAGSREAVASLALSGNNGGSLIRDAYLFFCDKLSMWLSPDNESQHAKRLSALHTAIRDDLQVVVIDLEHGDDPQTIFETLNALGTPLLPADLVKNYLFHLARFQHEDTTKLYDRFWSHFDDDKGYWRAEKRQGRLKRARLDLFLGHYLAMMTGEEINVSHLFSCFKEFVENQDGQPAATHMERFRSYADVYRRCDEFPPRSRAGVFFYRLEQMDTATPFPLLLEVCRRWSRPDHRLELDTILGDLESFLIRRAICGLTPKNYNRFFVDMVKTLRSQDDFSATAVRSFLLAETAETSRWPDDDEFSQAWLTIDAYKRLRRSRTRMILEAIEAQLHTGKTEEVRIEHKLTIEHLMPIEWGSHWPLLPKLSTPEKENEAIQFRNGVLHRFGNLTLLTKKLNPAISNSGWSDKRGEILKHSVLSMNHSFQNVEGWDEAAIMERSKALFSIAVEIWPRPKQTQATRVIESRLSEERGTCLFSAEETFHEIQKTDSAAESHGRQEPVCQLSGPGVSGSTGSSDAAIEAATRDSYQLFKDQKNRFLGALVQKHEVKVLMNWEDLNQRNIENCNNWFVCFAPVVWGVFKQGGFGIHFGFLWHRDRQSGMEYVRLPVGVENPLKREVRERFKEDVVATLKQRGIVLPGCAVWPNVGFRGRKLIEPNAVVLDQSAWARVLERYLQLDDFVSVVADVIRQYYTRRCFTVQLDFPIAG